MLRGIGLLSVKACGGETCLPAAWRVTDHLERTRHQVGGQGSRAQVTAEPWGMPRDKYGHYA